MFAPKGPIDKQSIWIDLDNGMAMDRQQTIAWTNADQVLWKYLAPMG